MTESIFCSELVASSGEIISRGVAHDSDDRSLVAREIWSAISSMYSLLRLRRDNVGWPASNRSRPPTVACLPSRIDCTSGSVPSPSEF